MKIGHLDTSERVVIVAEIGLNHEGDVSVARELVMMAADVGADAVKFQVYDVLEYADPSDPERYERLARFELPPGAFDDLADLAHGRGMAFIATPFDLESADLCNEICDAVKIASKDLDFWPLLDRVAAGTKPIILSTGMSDHGRISNAVTRIRWDQDLALLHCVSAYPVPLAEANLSAITLLAEHFPECEIGYSDHTISHEAVASLAVACGARIIEKHLTLDHDYSNFRDHAVSDTPDQFGMMVERVRVTELLLGEPVKRVMPCEQDMIAFSERERAFRVSRLA